MRYGDISAALLCYQKFRRYAFWVVFQSVIALWRSITLLQKRYCVMGSFWEPYYVIGAHNVFFLCITKKRSKSYKNTKAWLSWVMGTGIQLDAAGLHHTLTS